MDRPPLPSPPSAIAFTVFVDSNLNTHIAMAVSPGDSVADFKRKIRIEHELCFPDVGDISVRALKVKRRGAFYHLSDTMLVSSAFEGTKGTCFLHVDVVVTSISKNQGGTAEHFLTDRRERFAGNRQLLLEASKNLDNDRPHEKQSVFADGVDLSEPKSFSCLIENHKDTLNDPLDDRFHNGNESTHLHHHKRPGVDKEKQLRESDSRLKEAVEMPLVPNSNLFVNQVKDVREKKLPGLEAFDNRSPTTAPKEGESLKNNDIEPNSCLINANPGNNFVENKMGEEKTTTVEKPVEVNAAVFNDGGLNYVNEISNLEKNPGEVQLGTDVGNLAYPEQSLTILADGDSCLIGHLTDDKKKRKKKKRPAKCQQTEVDLSMPLNGNITISPHSGKVKNIEHEHALEESDPIGLVSEVMDGSNEATMLINFKQLTEKVDGGVEQVSRNVADEDSVVVNFSNKKDASDVNSMNMAKGSHSKSISNVDRKAVDADFNTDNVNMPCPKELSEKLPDGGSNLIDHLMDDKKKKKSRRRSSKSQQNEFDFAKPLSDQIAILPQSYEVHKIDLGAAIEKNDAICSEPKSQAGNNEGTGNSHRDMTNKFHDGTDRASEKVVDGDSLAVVTSSEKIGVSDFSSVRMAKDLDSYLVSSIDGMATETVKVKAASDDIHNELNTKSIVSSIITEPALLGNPAADASHSPNNFHRKKRSKKSSEKVLSSKYSVHSSEFTNEENPEEKHGIDFEGMDKESGLAINKDSLSQRDSTNLGSIDPTANVGSSHRKRRKKSEKAGSNNLQANICEPIHSLVNQANKDNHKEKLDDEDRQDLISLAEVNVLADCAVPTSELPAKSDYTKSDRKKKRSSKIELQDQQATQEELSEGLVKEPAEDTAKKLLNNHNKEPNKASYSFDNHNESAVLGGSEVDLVISVSANEKGAVRHKKKSAKSRSSGKRMSNCDIAHSIEDQSTPGNFENTTAGDEHPGGVSIVDALTNEALPNASHENLGEEHTTRMTNRGTKELVDASKCGGLPNDDNDKINFHDVFCPSSVQHGPIVSSNELLAAEAESKKQHKSKRKRKSSKHGATHDLGYPSESVKQRITESEHPNDELYSRSINNDSVKHTTDDSMNHAATFSNFMSPQNSNDSKVKVKIQDRKPDALHQQSLNLQEQSKHVISEKIFSRNTSAHEVLNQSKATAVTSYKKPPLDPAASYASLEDDTPIQAKRYRVAARKVPSRSSGRKLDNDNRNSAVLTSSAIFNAATSDDSEDEFELRARISTEGAASDTSSASSDSDEDLDNMQKIGSTSVANGGKDNGIDGEDIALSQLSRSRPLDAILRSSNSYKKAKLLASQSQAEDSDSQPVDVVLETQPEPDI